MAMPRLFRALPWMCGAALSGAIGCYSPDDGRSPPANLIYFPRRSRRVPRSRRMGKGPRGFTSQIATSIFSTTPGLWRRSISTRWRALRSPLTATVTEDCSGGKVCDLSPSKTGESPSHWCVDSTTRDPCPSPSGGPSRGESNAANRLISPGRCNFVDPGLFLKTSVSIGAFVTDVVRITNPTAANSGRLFLPVRGDATLHWVDVDDDKGTLDCGQGAGAAATCDANHRRGSEPSEENSRNLVLPPEPYGIAVDSKSEAISHHAPNDGASLPLRQ